MRILVISDNTGETNYLAGAVRRRGCDVTTVPSVPAGLAALDDVDLALLNIEPTSADIVAAVAEIRAKSDLPLIVMVTRIKPDNCAEVLLAGADDYLTRLVSIDELLARIHAVRRRCANRAHDDQVVRRGDVTIDLARLTVAVAGQAVRLSTKELQVLTTIAAERGEVCTRERLIAEIWGRPWPGAFNTLNVHIATLRAKLGRPDLVETVRGIGYRLRLDRPRAAQPPPHPLRSHSAPPDEVEHARMVQPLHTPRIDGVDSPPVRDGGHPRPATESGLRLGGLPRPPGQTPTLRRSSASSRYALIGSRTSTGHTPTSYTP